MERDERIQADLRKAIRNVSKAPGFEEAAKSFYFFHKCHEAEVRIRILFIL